MAIIFTISREIHRSTSRSLKSKGWSEICDCFNLVPTVFLRTLSRSISLSGGPHRRQITEMKNRQAHTKNYYYYYTKISDETCAFWALPVGPQRHYAPLFFVVLSPRWMRAWKGQAMNDEELMR